MHAATPVHPLGSDLLSPASRHAAAGLSSHCAGCSTMHARDKQPPGIRVGTRVWCRAAAKLDRRSDAAPQPHGHDPRCALQPACNWAKIDQILRLRHSRPALSCIHEEVGVGFCRPRCMGPPRTGSASVSPVRPDLPGAHGPGASFFRCGCRGAPPTCAALRRTDVAARDLRQC